MKKIIYSFIIFIFIGVNADAQIAKGSILLGGHVSYNTVKTDNTPNPQLDQKTKNASFAISAGKAFKENAFWGVALGYSSYSNNNFYSYNPSNPYKQNNDVYNAGIFYRKYKSLGKDFSVFGEGGISYSYNKNKTNDSLHLYSSDQKESGIGCYFTPGIAYKLCKKLQLEILIPNIIYANYSVTKLTTINLPNPDQTSKTNTFSFNTSLNPSSSLGSLGIGFLFIF